MLRARTRHSHQQSAVQYGFTIVELLIVIVIIGILAAITIVAYNGIQTRATNTKQISAAAAYLTLFQSYKIQNGDSLASLPAGCLGNNNIDTNADGIKDCGDNANVSVNNALLTSLGTVGTLPDVVPDVINNPDNIKRNGMYYLPTWNGNGRSTFIFYLRGSAVGSCQVRGATLDVQTGTNGTTTWCIVLM